MNIVKIVFYVLFYILVSDITTRIYINLSDWDEYFISILFVVSPILTYIWFLLAKFAGIFNFSMSNFIIFPKIYYNLIDLLYFFIYTIWLGLPIILKIVSVILSNFGYEYLSLIFYEQRYWSMMYVFIILCILVSMWQPAEDWFNKISRRIYCEIRRII